MCGRYTLTKDLAFLQTRFAFEVPRHGNLGFELGYNIAPASDVLVVTERAGKRTGSMMRWGLVPSWAKTSKPKLAPSNARAENLADSKTFGDAFTARRCLILADAFYAWRKAANRMPVRILLKSKEPFAFAGLWEHWPVSGKPGEPFNSCTIITTTPNNLIAPIYGRMPVILPNEAEAIWLDSSLGSDEALGLLKPYTADAMTFYEVSPSVNNVRNNGPELLTPAY